MFPSRAMVCLLLLVARYSFAQAVAPLIAEYKGTAEGQIALTNSTLVPMTVALEPQSFSIAEDGQGIYRSLDAGIHIKLSSRSVLVNPGQTCYVFYKAKAERLPAWFTIYSTFTAMRRTYGADVRILLPHTVYIYPNKPKAKANAIEVTQAEYLSETSKIVCKVANNSADLKRVKQVLFASASRSITLPGFPLLPGAKHSIEVDWNGSEPPREVTLYFADTALRLKIGATN